MDTLRKQIKKYAASGKASEMRVVVNSDVHRKRLDEALQKMAKKDPKLYDLINEDHNGFRFVQFMQIDSNYP